MKKGYFSYLSNKELINEVGRIKEKRDPWTSEARKELKNEMTRRKSTGKMKNSAGTKRNSKKDPYGFGFMPGRLF
jgi:hypothetical protein